jgi:hypothetical protein
VVRGSPYPGPPPNSGSARYLMEMCDPNLGEGDKRAWLVPAPRGALCEGLRP